MRKKLPNSTSKRIVLDATALTNAEIIGLSLNAVKTQGRGKGKINLSLVVRQALKHYANHLIESQPNLAITAVDQTLLKTPQNGHPRPLRTGAKRPILKSSKKSSFEVK